MIGCLKPHDSGLRVIQCHAPLLNQHKLGIEHSASFSGCRSTTN